MQNEERKGRLTSSQIYKICATPTKKSPITGLKWSAPSLTYFEEKRIERRLNRNLEDSGSGSSANWGKFMEMVVFSLMGIEYRIDSKKSLVHPNEWLGRYWAGSPDLVSPKRKIGEIKCYGLKKFCQYSDVILSKDLERFKKEFPEEYWQIVSNACIYNVPNGEAIAYAPYESEMPSIRDLASNYDGSDQWKYRFIAESEIGSLPVLKDDGYYRNLNTWEFEIPVEDKLFLTERVRLGAYEIDTNLNIEDIKEELE